MDFLSDLLDPSSHHGQPEEALAMALVLQQELSSRLTLLALHTSKHPEQMPRFAELAAELLCDLDFCEQDLYPAEGLNSLSQLGMGPDGPAGGGAGGGLGLN